MKINCIIVDDEALARKGLQKYVNEIDYLNLKGICKNAMEANTILSNEKIDLLFLDIEMPMLSGIEFLKALKHPPKVIFTTAYSEYAIESFEFDVLDYLVKPISFERFLQAANKAHRLISENSSLIDKAQVPEKEGDYIFIKTDKQLVKIILKEILFVESMQNYIRIFTKNESHITLVPLKKILDILPKNEFIQVHKSYLVSKSSVDAIIGNQLIIDEYKIPIGRSIREEVLNALVKDRVLRK
ncbi:MAG: response regulator transcription factor [Cytophagales bacterium]|nr:response regulator transcription factor [Cytophagales bacterium]